MGGRAPKKIIRSFLAAELLSASVEIFGVSRMWDFKRIYVGGFLIKVHAVGLQSALDSQQDRAGQSVIFQVSQHWALFSY